MTEHRIVWAIKVPGGWSGGGVWLHLCAVPFSQARLYDTESRARGVITTAIKRGFVDGRQVQLVPFSLSRCTVEGRG